MIASEWSLPRPYSNFGFGPEVLRLASRRADGDPNPPAADRAAAPQLPPWPCAPANLPKWRDCFRLELQRESMRFCGQSSLYLRALALDSGRSVAGRPIVLRRIDRIWDGVAPAMSLESMAAI
jgi:hypothetical protein